MKTEIIYTCEVCGQWFDVASDCEKHEAETHYSISISDYLKWKQLNKNAAAAGKQVGIRKTQETDRLFDQSVDELVAFEKAHKLTRYNHPINWCY